MLLTDYFSTASLRQIKKGTRQGALFDLREWRVRTLPGSTSEHCSRRTLEERSRVQRGTR